MNSNLTFRTATQSDAPLLARLNRELQEDERHRTIMKVAAIEPRMRKWLAGEYEGVLFERTSAVVGFTDYCITMEREINAS
jgi:hypothetical protein